VISVKATCSLSGDLTDQITVVDPSEKGFVLELKPDISELEESTDISFTLEVTDTSGDPVNNIDMDIDTDLGYISEIDESNTGIFEFIYFGVEVVEDEIETITIKTKKDGYDDGELEVTFTIRDQAPTSNANPTQNGQISADEYEFKIELDGSDFILHWRISGEKVKFALEARTTGWVAIGFDPTVKMKDADMVFGWVDGSGVPHILDCFSTGEFGPHPPDESDDILTYGGIESGGKTIIEFERNLQTGDPEDKNIPKEGDLKIIWATGSNDDYTSQHSTRGSGTIDLSSGEFTSDITLWPLHAAFMIIGLVLLILGICVAKTMKKKSWWYKVHKRLNIAGSGSSIIGLIIAIYMVQDAGTGHLRVPHTFLGLITILLLIISPILGTSIMKSGGSTNIDTKKSIHRWVGRLTMLLLVITIFSGLILVEVI
jgi:hypothetical protein